MAGTSKSILIGAGLLIFGILAALFLVEGYLALGEWGMDKGDDKLRQVDPLLGWSSIPGLDETYSRREWTTHVKTNSDGFRDIERAIEKGPGTFRIAVIGDSFVESLQVNYEDLFTHLLESKLNAGTDRYSRIEVMNFGVRGYGTGQELLNFREHVAKYDPDMVVLLFYPENDVADNRVAYESPSPLYQRPTFNLTGDGVIEFVPVNRSTAANADDQLDQSSLSITQRAIIAIETRALPHVSALLYNIVRYDPAVREALSNYGMKKPDYIPNGYYIYSPRYDKRWDSSYINGNFTEAWKVTEALLLALKKESEDSGAKFILVMATTRSQVYPDWWQESLESYPQMNGQEWDLEKPNSILGRFAEENSITYIDLLPYFKAYAKDTGPRLFLHYDGHWTKEGHRVAADAMYRSLILEIQPRASASATYESATDPAYKMRL
ncbi:MAG TPA: SGNH/GDSL hydrolase family protein [Methanotrichaceae archaeon]|nr:SGNH/GDSL hydrolase family protein [Methanotrichaceae archaeon]